MPLKPNISKPVSKKWLRLDNAAKIFPIITNRVRTSVFRLSVELSEPVNIRILQDALDKTLTDLPYFTSQLKKGFFWYWLEPTKVIPTVQYDDGPPCRKFAMSHRNHLLLRVLARNNVISAEFMHVLCDGAGGMQFLLCLVKNYGEKNNWQIDPSHKLISIDRLRQEELMEDSYKRYFNKYIPKPNSLSKAYHLPFKIGPNPEFKILPVQLNTQDIIARAKKYKVSLTEYLASIYLFVIQRFYLEEVQSKGKTKRSVIRIQIPVNLRNLFPSITLRNFALFIMPEIDPKLGAYSFEEITRIVHHYMQLDRS